MLAVIPILVGPLQVLMALLPALLLTLGSTLLALFRPSTARQSLRVLWRLKVPLVALVALGFGLVQAVRAMLPRPQVTATEAGARDWPVFRGGPQRLGAVNGSPAPLGGGINWTFRHEMRMFLSSPAVVGNRIYVTGAEKGVFTDRGAVYCLDADTGGLVWKAAPPGFRATFSSPSVSGRFLVVGEGLHYTRDSRVFCLDVTQQGRMLWSFRTSSHVESTACLAGDRAFIGAGDDGYYCFALEPESDGRARLLWHAGRERCPDAETPPVLHEGRLLVGLGLGGNALVCLEPETGRERWRVPTPYPVFTPPTVWSNRVYFGMGNGNFIETAAEAADKELARLKATGASASQLAEAAERLKARGEVWCVDLAEADAEARQAGTAAASSGVRIQRAVRWKFVTAEVVLGAIAVTADGVLGFSTRGGEFVALTADGRELARRSLQAPVLASPAAAGEHFYVVSENGRLFALEQRTLAPGWETVIGTTGPFVSSPTIARGRVYVGSQDDGLVCLGSASSGSASVAWGGARGGPGRAGHVDDSVLPARGTLNWRWPPADEAEQAAPAPRVVAPAAILGELLVVPVAEGNRRGLLGLTNDVNARLTPAERWFHSTSNGVWLSPALYRPAASAAEAPRVLLTDGQPGDSGRQLHCLDGRTGSVQWQLPLDREASGEFVLIGPTVLVQAGSNEVAGVDLAGRLLWRKPLGRLRGLPAGRHQLGVLAFADLPRLVALDLPTGAELWRAETEAVTGPVVEGGTLFLGVTNGICARRLTDGHLLWLTPLATPAQPLSLSGGVLATVTSSNELVMLDARSGRIQSRIPGALATQPPVLVRDEVLYAVPGALMVAAAADPDPKRWMATGWLGDLSAPPVLSDSAVYFATAERGFIKAGRAR